MNGGKMGWVQMGALFDNAHSKYNMNQNSDILNATLNFILKSGGLSVSRLEKYPVFS